MQSTSISHLAGAANSKLAAFLRRREEEESRLNNAARRGRDINNETGRPHRQSRFTTPPSFSRPTPLIQRSTPTGARPFHFEMKTVGRNPSAVAAQTSCGAFSGRGPGFEHAVYVERDGAAEAVVSQDREAYLSREDAVEQHGSITLLTRDEAQALLGVPELDGMGAAPLVGGDLAVLSNISDDIIERQTYWSLVNDHERKTHSATLLADPSRCPEWWDRLVTDTVLDRDLHRHLLTERDRYVRHIADRPDKTFRPLSFKVPVHQRENFMRALETVGAWDERQPPVSAKVRHGRVQTRMIAELPHEATPAERLEIVRDFCAGLERVERNKQGQWVGWMYTAVIHAPDENNDRRNYHLHVIAHDRPARFLPEHCQWDFAVAETHQHRGEVRTRYPHRQRKLVAVSQSKRAKDQQGRQMFDRDDVGRGYTKHLREAFAASVNKVLERKNTTTRFHPGTLAECGMVRTQTEHLGHDHKPEQIGIATAVGDRNAIAIWDDEEQQVRRRHEHRMAELDALLDRAGQAGRHAPNRDTLDAVLSLRSRISVEAANLSEQRLEIDLVAFALRKGRSRAEFVRDHCRDMLEAGPDVAKRARKDVTAYARRKADAEAYLADFAQVGAIERRQLELAANGLAEKEKRLEHQIRQLSMLLNTLSQAPLPQDRAADTIAATGGAHGKSPLPPTIAAGSTEFAETPLPSISDPLAVNADAALPHMLGASRGRSIGADATEPPLDPAGSAGIVIGHDPKADRQSATSSNETVRPLVTPTLTKVSGRPGRISPGRLAARQLLDTLLTKISEDRLPVSRMPSDADIAYRSPVLDAALSDPALGVEGQARAQARLMAIYRFQQAEIKRLATWVGKAVFANLVEFETALLAAPKSVRTLHKHWGSSDEVRNAVSAGIKRGNPVASAIDVAPSGIDVSPIASTKQRSAEEGDLIDAGLSYVPLDQNRMEGEPSKMVRRVDPDRSPPMLSKGPLDDAEAEMILRRLHQQAGQKSR
ncbi:MobA/MobL family protein [Sphingomonas sp. 2R-10]|uniref:MobA/MobL family protein n=1 Tax=Sphingomonas sp. 2R-10 TaxID=3045148 RepID=UPI0013DE69C9|nr:MobA/MobL family protein [Sphingomonas sp. 2R-10]MDJ0276663.1 MobA/MobL family protein [Sphingomonas sp. 2R-10]